MDFTTDFFRFTEPLLLFGIASGILSTFAFIPYIIDTIAGRTQPQRASWLIWSVLGSIAFVSQIFEGATSSLWFAGVQVTGTIIVFSLSIWVGIGNYLSKTDYAILVAAGIGLVLWYFTETAAYALTITISISLLGGIATVAKAYQDPESETLSTWAVSLIASVCAIFSVGKTDLILLAYPLYLFTLYLAFIVAIVLGRMRGRAARQVEGDWARVSPGPVFSMLRTGADAVIVCAAIIYTINWLGTDLANSTEQSLVVSGARDASTIEASNTKTRSPNKVLRGAIRDTDLPLFSPPDSTIQEPRVLVVAMQLNDGIKDQQQILDENDPLSKLVMKRVEKWRALDSNEPLKAREISIQQDLNSILNNQLISATVTARPLTYMRADVADSKVPADNREFQMLDSGDPFTRLTVASEYTRLLNDTFQTVVPGRVLPRGTRLVAIATDGEWFRVKTLQGEVGHVHRTKITVDLLAMNGQSHQ